jgi:hypothetical protein
METVTTHGQHSGGFDIWHGWNFSNSARDGCPVSNARAEAGANSRIKTVFLNGYQMQIRGSFILQPRACQTGYYRRADARLGASLIWTLALARP